MLPKVKFSKFTMEYSTVQYCTMERLLPEVRVTTLEGLDYDASGGGGRSAASSPNPW